MRWARPWRNLTTARWLINLCSPSSTIFFSSVSLNNKPLQNNQNTSDNIFSISKSLFCAVAKCRQWHRQHFFSVKLNGHKKAWLKFVAKLVSRIFSVNRGEGGKVTVNRKPHGHWPIFGVMHLFTLQQGRNHKLLDAIDDWFSCCCHFNFALLNIPHWAECAYSISVQNIN